MQLSHNCVTVKWQEQTEQCQHRINNYKFKGKHSVNRRPIDCCNLSKYDDTHLTAIFKVNLG